MGVRYHVEGSGFRLQGFGFRFTDKSLELRVQATGCYGPIYHGTVLGRGKEFRMSASPVGYTTSDQPLQFREFPPLPFTILVHPKLKPVHSKPSFLKRKLYTFKLKT